MKITKRIFILIIGIFVPLFLFSQTPKVKVSNQVDRKLMRADEYYQEEDYEEALKNYLEVIGFFKEDASLNYKIGKCYLESLYKTKSIPFLEKANSIKPGVEEDLQFLLGRAYQLNLEFDKAISEFHNYSYKLGSYDIRKVSAQKHIEECEYGKKLMVKPRNFEIYNIGTIINTVYPEYRPVISADESVMMFTTRRKGSIGSELVKDDIYNEDIYVSYKREGKWTSPENLGTPINTKNHEACLAIAADGQKIYLYKDDKGDGNIYECKLYGDLWSKPVKMGPNINTEFFEGDASLSADENTFFFVSDRTGGYGGKDIYYCKKQEKGNWGPAENIGPVINTEYDEVGPFFHPDGKTFFFSSTGHQTMGGFDIFRSKRKNDGTWEKPKNIGYPINTADDDLYFVLSASAERGYYASIKDGGSGEKDIYVISRKKKITEGGDEKESEFFNPLTLLTGIITDQITKHPLEANIQVVDNEKGEVIANFVSNSKTGKYLVSLPSGKNYGISVSKDGYLFHSENFNIPLSKGFTEVRKDIELNKASAGSAIILHNVFFDLDKAILRYESKLELQRLEQLMKTNPTIKIEISGHTDNTGSDHHNVLLSEARAKAVVDYLVGLGISSNRMISKGYASSQPIADNETEEGRQLNRRTECKVISK